MEIPPPPILQFMSDKSSHYYAALIFRSVDDYNKLNDPNDEVFENDPPAR
jgi:hypothetical protein